MDQGMKSGDAVECFGVYAAIGLHGRTSAKKFKIHPLLHN